MADLDPPDRGPSSSTLRAFTCKECRREVEALERELEDLQDRKEDRRRLKQVRKDLEARRARATYNEHWALGVIERGGSRSDRCKDHRQRHQVDISGLAVAYIDLETVGEVADRSNPTGPLGGLGPLPSLHEIVEGTSYDLEQVNVGMTDAHIVEIVQLLREKQVLILKAGTGTGKSTFVPYRLMDPPPASLTNARPEDPFVKLTDLGQIIVTEPRVQAAIGVASFVGGVMSGAGNAPAASGVGPGFPVGYQVSGDRNHDEACDLVYVTDGTMINWLREGRLSRIGTVIVDEAHERSTNIDFILGFLKQELPRYPHLRVIITSATFDTAFYEEYFGGPGIANVMEVPAVKAFGYGMPLFPELDAVASGEVTVAERWTDPPLPAAVEQPRQARAFIERYWPDRWGPPLLEEDVLDPEDVGTQEDIWETTEHLVDLRFTSKVDLDRWPELMPAELTRFVISLAKGLDREEIFGDILAFLPTTKTILPACDEIERALGGRYKGHVFPLISTLEPRRQRDALAKRRKGDPRKIVVSTNLAETSLTVEGVRFVVDSGVIAQSEWDPDLVRGSVPTRPHSQSGIRQRWGRVGRKAPGWVFPLYTKGQFIELPQDTPPGSTRDNLESLVMTAKMGGIDDAVGFPWPAAFQPETTQLDPSALDAQYTFRRELARADRALHAGGAVDADGHPTPLGKELNRLKGQWSASGSLAILYADRLACVPEVAMILALLEDVRLIGPSGLLLDDPTWPDEWRLEAAERHRALAAMCRDDAHLVLLISAGWERADEHIPPWEASEQRQRWARRWFVNDEVLLAAANQRQEVLGGLSPAMKEEVKRFVDPALIDRARGAISRAFVAQQFRRLEDGSWESSMDRVALEPAPSTTVAGDGPDDDLAAVDKTPTRLVASLEADQLTRLPSGAATALRRREARDDNRVANLVEVTAWAPPAEGEGPQTGTRDAMRLLAAAATYAKPDPTRALPLHLMASWPIGQRVRLVVSEGELEVDEATAVVRPFALPRPDQTGPRRRSRRPRSSDLESADGTVADTVADLATQRSGRPDEEQLEERAFAAADRAQATEFACGSCFPCMDGRPDACDDAPTTAGEKVNDPLQGWLAKSRSAGEPAGLRFVPVEGSEAAEGWFEVVGYDIDDPRSPGIEVLRDWRPEGFQGNPAQHLDVTPGLAITVKIGPMTSHHGGDVRVFLRADGRGRFLVREASSPVGRIQEQRGEIALSLDRSASGLLAGLTEGEEVTATVVPARVGGCYTVTLLELLQKHLAKAAPGQGFEYHVLDTSRRNAKREPVYHATVDGPPNPFGYVTATLRCQDLARGIRHHFSFTVNPRHEPDHDGAGAAPAPDPAPAELPEWLLLHVVRDIAQLDVGDLDLDELERIAHDEARQLKLLDAVDERASAQDPDQEDEVERRSAPGAVLRSISTEPLSRHAAEALTALDDSSEWANEVWSFWARSHHLRVDPRLPYLPGSPTEVIDLRSDVDVSGPDVSPTERRRRAVASFAAVHGEGSVVDGTVDQTTDGSVFVHLGEGVEGRIPLGELAWEFTDHASDVVAPGEPVRVLVTAIDLDGPAITLSRKRLLPKPYEVFKSTLAIGGVVSCVVERVTPSHVHVRLDEGRVKGAIYVGELAHDRVEDPAQLYAEGDELQAQILGFDDKRQQVELSLKRLLPDPYVEFKTRHDVGDEVKARVERLTGTMVFVRFKNGAKGAIRVANLQHEHTRWPSEVVEIEGKIRAQIIGFDDDRQQVQLSVKALLPKPYPAFKASHRVGQQVEGTVSGIIDAFVFVSLPGGADGSIHVSKLANHRIGHPSEIVSVGQRVTCTILGFDDVRKKVQLALVRTSGPAAPTAPRPAAPRPTAPRPPARSRRTARGEGTSVPKATAEAAAKLGLSTAQVHVRVIQEPKIGLLGRTKTPAIVEVTER